MEYKGFTARIEFDADDRIFIGHLAGIQDIVGFHGPSVADLETAFHEAVDDYLSASMMLNVLRNHRHNHHRNQASQYHSPSAYRKA
jgi:predicted HicB family RNase H-like nuclease